MRELVPAWPPGAKVSTMRTSRPLEAAYTAAARPAGPAPLISTSCTRSSWGVDAQAFGDFGIAGVLQQLAAAANHDGNVLAPDVKALEQRLRVGIVFNVDIHVGAGVTRQELP